MEKLSLVEFSKLVAEREGFKIYPWQEKMLEAIQKLSPEELRLKIAQAFRGRRLNVEATHSSPDSNLAGASGV